MNGDPVPCSDIVIRLLSRRGHVFNGEATAEAFILRSEDAGRLSVFRKVISDIHVCKNVLKKIYGAATLHPGRIRAADYLVGIVAEVVEAEAEGTDIPGHAAIVGLPDPLTQFEEAERVATILRNQSRGISVS